MVFLWFIFHKHLKHPLHIYIETMFRFIITFCALLSVFNVNTAYTVNAANHTRIYAAPCISFNVSSGTGCAWMCTYCANQLGTNNYYFPDGVCTYQPLSWTQGIEQRWYQTGGCVGNPIAGQLYTCCAVGA